MKYETKPHLQKILKILFKKDKSTYEQIFKKIEEIRTSKDVEHYKNLKKPLQALKRVHIGHFVLIFKFNKSKNLISFENYAHHDKIYK